MTRKIKNNSVLISASSSGSGKTTVVCGILSALKKRGLNISAFKCGPDYIDPMFHSKILGIKSKNLDSFFCDDKTLKLLYGRDSEKSDISVIEGVMGYYDGLSMESDRASSYEVAKILKANVILVLNAKGMALSSIALIKGFKEFRADSNIKGVILNNISKPIFEKLKPVIENELGIKALGFLPKIDALGIESRHLGLITPEEIKDINNRLERLGEITEESIHIDEIIKIAKNSEELEIENEEEKQSIKQEKIKIAVASDNAFCFYYKDNLELLKELGCEIEYFSPLKDKNLPKGIKGIIIGGGYPELYLKELSENKEMLREIKESIENNMPILAECGGFMYLNEAIEDEEGKAFEMVGAINGRAIKKDRLVRFGYITLTAEKDTYVLKKGEKIKAHEFHYWDCIDNGDSFRADKPTGNRNWQCIHSYKNLICGFPHIYFYSNKKFAENFVKKCRER